MLDKITEYLDKKENIIFIRNVLLNNNDNVSNIIFNFKCHLGPIYDNKIIGNDDVDSKKILTSYKNYTHQRKELIGNMNMVSINNFYSSMMINNIIDGKIMFEDIHINYIIILMDEIRKSFNFSEKEKYISNNVIKHIIGIDKISNSPNYRLTTPNKHTHFVDNIINNINTIIGENLYLHDFDKFIFKDSIENSLLIELKKYLDSIHVSYKYDSIKYLYYEHFNVYIIIKSDGEILSSRIDDKHDKWKHFVAVKRKVNIQNLLNCE